MASVNDLGIGMVPFLASEAIVANSFVKLHTVEGYVAPCTAMADIPIGVCATTGVADGQVLVQIMGQAKLRLEDTVSTIGVDLCVYDGGTGGGDAAGSLGGTVVVAAKALQAGVSGDIISVILTPNGFGPTL